MPRTQLAAIGLFIAAAVLGACDTIRVEERRGAFWEAFVFGPAAEEVSRFDSLAEMLEASDAVVVAHVSDVAVSRIFQGDVPEDRFPYLRVQLAIDRVIRGDAPGVVQIEFLGSGTDAQAQALVDELKGELPADSVVVFLHAKNGAGEAGLYRVINSTGLWAPTTRTAVDAPLRMEAPHQGPYAAELARVGDMNGLVELLDGLAK